MRLRLVSCQNATLILSNVNEPRKPTIRRQKEQDQGSFQIGMSSCNELTTSKNPSMKTSASFHISYTKKKAIYKDISFIPSYSSRLTTISSCHPVSSSLYLIVSSRLIITLSHRYLNLASHLILFSSHFLGLSLCQAVS
jgi:hypothetical protein